MSKTITPEHTHEHFAALMLVCLVKRVLEGKTRITYTDLANAVDYPDDLRGKEFPNHIGVTLGTMGDLLEGCQRALGEDLPLIQALVVRESTNVPGPGFARFCPGYWEMSDEDKEAVVRKEEEKVVNFGVKWKDLTVEYTTSTIKKWYKEDTVGSAG